MLINNKINMKSVLMNLEIIAINIMLTMFVLSGIEKIVSFDKNVNQLKNALMDWGAEYPTNILKFLLIASLMIEIFAPILVNYGITTKKYSYIIYSVYSLIALVMISTIIFYIPPVGQNYYPFISNVTTIGGLLLIIAEIKYS